MGDEREGVKFTSGTEHSTVDPIANYVYMPSDISFRESVNFWGQDKQHR